MGKWVIGSGLSKIRPIPLNNRVYGYTVKRVWVQSSPFHTRLIRSGPDGSGPDPLTGLYAMYVGSPRRGVNR